MRNRLLAALAATFAVLALPAAAEKAPPWRFFRIADTQSTIPLGVGEFLSFDRGPVLRREPPWIVFLASGSGGQQGVYLWEGAKLEAVADTATAIPDGAGSFDAFFQADLDRVLEQTPPFIVFRGGGSGGQDGIYLATDLDLGRIADTATAIPGGSGSFNAFVGASVENGLVAFSGSGASEAGVYASDEDGPVTLVADTHTAIPGGAGDFIELAGQTSPCFHPPLVVFPGEGSGLQRGIYFDDGGGLDVLVDADDLIPGGGATYDTFTAAGVGAPLVAFVATDSNGGTGVYGADTQQIEPEWIVADTDTVIPGGIGGAKFTGFGNVSMSKDEVAFIGLGSKGIFATRGGELEEVISVGDLLDDQVILDLDLGEGARDGDAIAFWAELKDGTTGIYLAQPFPPLPSVSMVQRGVLALVLLGAGIVGMASVRRRRRKV
jgi:hypothetical protein